MLDRRNFLKAASLATAETLVGSNLHALTQPQDATSRPIAANDHIQFALIGAGIRGQAITQVALQIPGAKLVAVSDTYQGRRDHSKELWGNDIFTTVDYKEILTRKDIDAVVIATPDHWHKQVAVDAMHAGKDVYCEKPMIHRYSDGPEMIAAARATNCILQIGSQRVSNVAYIKAKELLAAGAIGKLNMVTAWWDRNSALGAWDYSVPLDASPQTCDWPQFLGTAPQIPFSAEQFFQWRKWKAYGSGVAGDLFVHLFSGTHFVAGVHGPTRAMATGGLRFWKDGRNVPDVMVALYDYPEAFNLNLRVNFVNGGSESEGLIFTGDEGTMAIYGNSVTLNSTPLQKEPGYTVETFTFAMQKQFIQKYREMYPVRHPMGAPPMRSEVYAAARDYDDVYSHFYNFFHSVRTRQPVVEDAVFGYRAAGAALLSNLSYYSGKVQHWNPETMQLEA